MNQQKSDLTRLTVMALLTALAYASVLFSSIVFPVKISGFLSIEPKDCILAIGAFLFDPMAGLAMTVITGFLEMVTFSATGWIGLLMNVLSSTLFVVPAAVIYRKVHTQKGAILGLSVGTLCMLVGMLAWNVVVTPAYMMVERQMVVDMLLPVFLPFNLLKGAINAALTMVLYKSAEKLLRKMHLLPKPTETATSTGNRAVWIVALILAVSLILVALAWAKII